MFTSLHSLAKQATLMITIAAEGADQLRVNVTPMPFDDKAKARLPKPLSLLATPAEFDADFIAAIAAWQAPKRSLVEQAQASAEEPASAAGAKPSGKTDKSSTRTRRSSKTVSSEDEPSAVQTAGEAAGEAVAAADQVMAADEQPPVDTGAAPSEQPAAAPAAEDPPVAEPQAEPAAEPQDEASKEEGAAAPAQDATELEDKLTLDLF